MYNIHTAAQATTQYLTPAWEKKDWVSALYNTELAGVDVNAIPTCVQYTHKVINT